MERVTAIQPALHLREDWQARHRRPGRRPWVLAELRAHPARLVAIAAAAMLAFGGGVVAAPPAPAPRADGAGHPARRAPATHRPHDSHAPAVRDTPTAGPVTVAPRVSATARPAPTRTRIVPPATPTGHATPTPSRTATRPAATVTPKPSTSAPTRPPATPRVDEDATG